MKKNQTNLNSSGTKSQPANGGLRIVPCDKSADQEEPVAKREENPFVKFMNAYADAIDNDVKSILEL
jgi:hypothetical protein